MGKGGLKITAGILAALMGLVWVARLDDLPRDVRAQIASERTALAAAQKQIAGAKDAVAQDESSEPALFHALPSAALYSDRLSRAAGVLAAASRDGEQLARMEKDNRRSDAEQAKALLAHQRQMRDSAVKDADAVRKEAAQWIDRKKNLPNEVRDMERDHNAIHGPDLAAVTAAVQKAETDWPEKRVDLQNRLDSVNDVVRRADEAWNTSAAARQAAAASDASKVDFAALFTAADTLQTASADVTAKSNELRGLTGQLYTSWDKLLVDLRHEKNRYEEQLRTVTTRDNNTTSEEKWAEVSKQQYQAMERNLGMAVEHKATGKYDAEAEKVAQPAGFAYMAPPGQRNQYGYWDHSGGGSFWVWYGQYALLRDLLFNHSYRPLPPWEYQDYYSYRQRNQTYYGRDTETSSAPKYGTGGTATQERYSGSSFAKSGGFKDSRYASKPGGYRDSQYSTPAMRNPDADHNGRTFGSGSSRQSSPRAAPAPSRPAPRPSAPRSSPGRTFGSRRR